MRNHAGRFQNFAWSFLTFDDSLASQAERKDFRLQRSCVSERTVTNTLTSPLRKAVGPVHNKISPASHSLPLLGLEANS
jgi:hypothetical protein